MKNLSKKLLLRFALLSVFLVASQYLYKAFFFEQDLKDNSPVYELIEALDDSVQVIYFGESSNFTVSDFDLDKSRISDMIARFYPDKIFGTINKGALHGANYLKLIKILPKEAPIETLIITLNLRSFNPQWIESDLETSLAKSMVLLGQTPALFNRARLSFKGYDIKSKTERSKIIQKHLKKDKIPMLSSGTTTTNIIWEEEFIARSEGQLEGSQRNLGMHYIRTYGFLIDPLSNPRIKDFDKIVRYAQKKNWDIVFNLLAENTDKAGRLIGNDLVDLMNYNGNLLVQRYQAEGVSVVNNLEAVRDSSFLDQNWTTEHYDEKGRLAVASAVGQELRNKYPDAFSPARFTESSLTRFFNDCEGSVAWGFMHTCTDEKAYSGKYSSRVDPRIPYSIAFNRPIATLPKDSLENISVSFYIFQENISQKSQLILETLKDDKKVLWTNISLNSPELPTGKWVLFEANFAFNEKVKNSDLLKLYVWNPGQEVIYIDDFTVHFD